MLAPDRDDGLAFVSVEEERVPQAVERLKRTLPEDLCECPDSGYAGRAFRWGIKAYPAKEPRRVALVLCCPDCERPTDLPGLGAGPPGGA